MFKRSAIATMVVVVISCSSKTNRSRMFGPIPEDAGDLLARICGNAEMGVLEEDPDLKIAKQALIVPREGIRAGAEAVMCSPENGPNPSLNSLAFDHATRRLYGLHAMVTYGDMPLLERLLLPALTPSERLGYGVEKMRLLTPWMGTSINHDWTDGHLYIWTRRLEAYNSADDLRPPTPQTKFQIIVTARN
jgi:hypothetical protein